MRAGHRNGVNTRANVSFSVIRKVLMWRRDIFYSLLCNN